MQRGLITHESRSLLFLLLLGCSGCGRTGQTVDVPRSEIVKLMAGPWKSDMVSFNQCEFIVENPTDPPGEMSEWKIGSVEGEGVTLEWKMDGSFVKTSDGKLRHIGGLVLARNEDTPSGELWRVRHGSGWRIVELNKDSMVLEDTENYPDLWKFQR